MKTKENSLAITHPDIAAEWHPTKNGERTPQHVTCSWSRWTWWLCPKCGHEWRARVVSRVHGDGCPVCAKMKKR